MKLTIDEQIEMKREDKKGAMLYLSGLMETVDECHARYQHHTDVQITNDTLLTPAYSAGTGQLLNAIEAATAQRIIIYGIEREIAALENCKRHMA